MTGSGEATEAAARKAAELGVDLGAIEGSGADGNITVGDVVTAVGAEARAESGTIKLAPRDFRVDSFDPKVEGVEPLTPAGTEVPAGKEQEVREAAVRSKVEIKEVK